MAYRIQLITFGALFVGACGIDAVGLDPITDGAAPMPTVDGGPPAPTEGGALSDAMATPEAGVDASVCADACSALALAAPDFTLVAFGDAKTPCPAGFDPTELVGTPFAKGGSCTCPSCTATATCNVGAVQTKGGNATTSCQALTGDAVPTDSGGCHPSPGGSYDTDYAYVSPPAAVAPKCDAPGVADRTKVDAERSRACTPRPDTCAGAICEIGSRTACLMAAGDHACPASAPKKTMLGRDFSATCTPCACTPNVTCAGTFNMFAGANCSGTAIEVPASTCTKVNKPNVNSSRWDGKIGTATCSNLIPAALANVAMTDLTTVCCP